MRKQSDPEPWRVTVLVSAKFKTFFSFFKVILKKQDCNLLAEILLQTSTLTVSTGQTTPSLRSILLSGTILQQTMPVIHSKNSMTALSGMLLLLNWVRGEALQSSGWM